MLIRDYAYVSSWPISVVILLLISVFFRVRPWLMLLPLLILLLISVFFRVRPWQMLLLLLGFPSVFVRGKLSLLIVFLSVEFCFNRWISSASCYSSYRGLFFCFPNSILPLFIKNVQK